MAGKLSSLFLLVLVSGLGTAIFLGIAFKDDERSPTDIFMHHAFSLVIHGQLSPEGIRLDDGTHVEKMTEARERMEKFGSIDRIDSSLFTDIPIPMRDGHINMARLYHPPGYPSNPLDAVYETWPVLIWIHGGGFCIGNRLQNDPYLAELAETANVLIYSVDYRLAPQFPFPYGPNDVLDHYLWVQKNIEKYHGDIHRIAAGGESAGGALTAVLSQDVRDLTRKGEDVGSLKTLLLTAPVTDGNLYTDSHHTYGFKYGLTRQMMFGFLACYGGVDFAKIQDPRMFPLHGDLSDLPPAVVIVFNHDPLSDEGIAYAKALQMEGVPTELHILEGTHVSATILPILHQEQYQITLSSATKAIQRM